MCRSNRILSSKHSKLVAHFCLAFNGKSGGKLVPMIMCLSGCWRNISNFAVMTVGPVNIQFAAYCMLHVLNKLLTIHCFVLQFIRLRHPKWRDEETNRWFTQTDISGAYRLGRLLSLTVCYKPTTDLCWECHKNNNDILRAVNCTDDMKSEKLHRQEANLQHMRAAR